MAKNGPIQGTFDPAKLRPLRDRVLGRRLDAVTQVGSIVIPETAQKKQTKIKVLAVGKGVEELKVGMTVLIGPYHELELGDETLVLFREDDVRVVIPEGSEAVPLVQGDARVDMEGNEMDLSEST